MRKFWSSVFLASVGEHAFDFKNVSEDIDRLLKAKSYLPMQ